MFVMCLCIYDDIGCSKHVMGGVSVCVCARALLALVGSGFIRTTSIYVS